MHEEIERLYKSRLGLLEDARKALESEVVQALQAFHQIDRISFRVKSVQSFLDKAFDPENNPPYVTPLREIEDQLAGRIVVFFLGNIPETKRTCLDTFNVVESTSRKPKRDEEFGYESEHFIFQIPPHVKPDGWEEVEDLPTTFELQIRTLFMHAWAEPQHDLAYKSASDLPGEVRRELAWIAASAWGADRAYDSVRARLAKADLPPIVLSNG